MVKGRPKGVSAATMGMGNPPRPPARRLSLQRKLFSKRTGTEAARPPLPQTKETAT